jgi:hypothetical protein
MQVDNDEPEIIERMAALGIGKAEVVCCVRVPGPRGQRMQEVRTVSTMTAALLVNRYLARLLGEAAIGTSRTDTFLGERYRRSLDAAARSAPSSRSARSILMVVWALLSDADAYFVDLGPAHYHARTNSQRRVRNHVRELQALGYTVTLNPAA